VRETEDYQRAWKKLRRQVRREQRRYEGKGTNKDDRALATALTTAYGSVLRMMDRLDKPDTVTGHRP
jgi:hypothetical protein